MTQRMVMIALILVIVLGGGLYAYRELVPPPAEESSGPIYSTAEVIRGDISVGVETKGILRETHGGGIRVPGERYYSQANITYVIDKILVEEGDAVEKGQVLATLQSPDIEIQLEQKRETLRAKEEELSSMTGVPVEEIDRINPSEGITVKAPVDGRVINLEVEEGDELQQGSVICRVVNDSRFVVRAKLTPSEFKKVKKEQKVVLSFPYFAGFYEGVITDVNPNPIPDKKEKDFAKGFVHMVTIEGENPGLVQPGMEVSIGIPVGGENTQISFFANKGKVEGFIEEEKVISRAEAIVTEVYVYEMDLVKKGDPILSMAGSDVQKTLEEKLEKIRELRAEIKQLETKLGQMEIKASLDGVVGSIHKQEGDTVRPGEWIGSIFNTSEMMMWVQVDDIDIVHVKPDAPVKVTVDAVQGETFKGKVMHVSTTGEEMNGVTKFRVSIRVEGSPQLRPGMQATAYIDAGSAENVLLVPLEAIFEEDGKPMVEVLEPDGRVKTVTVKVGLMNDRYAEIKSGLKEGELVITGSTADLLPSQHIKSEDSILPDKNDDNQDSGNTGTQQKD